MEPGCWDMAEKKLVVGSRAKIFERRSEG